MRRKEIKSLIYLVKICEEVMLKTKNDFISIKVCGEMRKINEHTDIFIYLIVMAGVTYLIRAILRPPFLLFPKSNLPLNRLLPEMSSHQAPLTVFTGKIENRFIKSFLAYVPYAVLGAMTFPAIIYSTADLISGIAGTVVGVFFAYKRKSLLTVAVAACLAVLLVSVIELAL